MFRREGMMTLDIWHDATLVTMIPDDDYGIIENGAMVVKEGKIMWVGPQSDLPKKFVSNSQFICAKGHCITPGLIDCHTHLIYAGQRRLDFEKRLQGENYSDIQNQGEGIYTTVEATRLASSQQLFDESAARVQHFLQEGVTTIEIKSGYGLDFETERKILSVGKRLMQVFPVDIQTTFLGAHVLPKEFLSTKQYITSLIEDILPKLVDEGLVDAVDGFCDQIAFGAEDLERLFVQAQKYHLLIKVHADQLTNSKGAQLAAKFNAVSADHLEYIDEEGIQALKESGSIAVLLPGAYYFLQHKQKPPVALFRAHQIPIAIATDCNPGSCPTTSLLLMLNMACTLFNLTPLEALQGVTQNAATALGMGKEKGRLAPGFIADFVMWKVGHPSELAYRFGDNRCYQVIKNGKIVYEHINTFRSFASH